MSRPDSNEDNEARSPFKTCLVRPSWERFIYKEAKIKKPGES